MNIGKLAIEHGITITHNGYAGETNLLNFETAEAFAKALQSSEPVVEDEVRDLILELKCLGEVLAMEMTTIEGNPIAPVIDDAWQTIERLITHPPATVPLEKYNKLLDALREAKDDIADWGSYAPEFFQQKHDLAGDIAKYDLIIAEAEGISK